MDYQYGYQQHRSRSHSRIPQQSSPGYRSAEHDYSASGTGPTGNYFGASRINHFGGDNRPRRSRSLDNRRDLIFSDNYGFSLGSADDRYTGGTMRYQSHHQHQHQQQQPRNYDYQQYLSISTGPIAEYRSTYDGRRGVVTNDYHLDNQMVPYQARISLPESDWDALDRSIRNYREDLGAEPMIATSRRSKPQSLSPIRHNYDGTLRGGTKSSRQNLSSFFHRHSGIGSGGTGPQSGTSTNKNELVLQNRTDYHHGGCTAVQDEVEFGADRGLTSYYRGGAGSSNQQQHHQSFYGSAGNTGTMRGGGGATMNRSGVGGITRYDLGVPKYYKLHCCCFSFRWPPWAFEEVDPPQPMYRRT
ncbi:unnamed protein product [Thelazia callipaeda]|uniref:Zasp-like motif domain-containing protein n=1 Tax=Thelazia callipaeda TaxID=103827 RepID=A0A0N5D1M7_THECL|nr:unnamed protein product [Thelazia callipaeda]